MQNPNNELPPKEPSRLLTPVPDKSPHGELIEVQAINALVTPETPLDRCPCSLDLLNPRHAALAVACMGVADIQLDRTGRAIVKAVHYLIYGAWQPREDEKGHDWVIFTALIDKQGRVFKTSGVYAPDAVKAAAQLYSAKEWAEGVTFLITESKTPKGRIAHTFRILIDQEDVEGPAT